jgi:hypothetical protein
VFTDPPPDETDEQRVVREAREAEEKRVSDEIDEGIRKDKAAMKKERELVVKVLLLGQSESGKSTTLKSRSCPFCFMLSVLGVELTELFYRFPSSVCSASMERGTEILASSDSAQLDPLREHNHRSYPSRARFRSFLLRRPR